MMPSSKKIIVIVGPTASGKSDIANVLASQINAEVVSADSMQIYKGMDIGTGKLMPDEQLVKHWGIDICNPNQAYSAALFQKYSRFCFKDIALRGKNTILCGGTGFYVRAAIDNYEFPKGKQTNNEIRDRYQKYLNENGKLALWELLYSLDKESAHIIHKNNSVRVIRALELLENGKSYAQQTKNLSSISQKYKAIFFGLKVDPKILEQRINYRVDKMFENGLVKEVKKLLDQGYRDALTAASAIGYKEIVAYFNNETSLEDAKEQIKISSRRYAKRQRTWFNRDKRINWIEYNNSNLNYAVDTIKSKI